jgi:hypothetical protein
MILDINQFSFRKSLNATAKITNAPKDIVIVSKIMKLALQKVAHVLAVLTSLKIIY